MRTSILSFAFLCLSFPSLAQDAGALAAQQANEAAIAANQQAMQASQQASQAAMTANQQAAAQGFGALLTSSPGFSVRPGSYPAATEVRLKSHTRGARIYYTTDGWTPTADSTAYTGPIAVDHTQTIQAIAIAPGAYPSTVAKAEYTIAAGAAEPPALSPKPSQAGTFQLTKDMPLDLIFLAGVDSQTASVGDRIPLALASDLMVDGAVLAAKGTPATAKVTAVDPAGRASLPGIITFTITSIRINGVDVPLSGTKTRQAPTHLGRQAFLLIPAIGAASLLKHGDPAEILANTPVTALVAANTAVPMQPGTPASR